MRWPVGRAPRSPPQGLSSRSRPLPTSSSSLRRSQPRWLPIKSPGLRFWCVSVDDDSILVFRDGSGRQLLVADALQILQCFVEAGPQGLARRERRGQVLHALNDTDGLVVLGAFGVADVVGHPVEDRGQ